MHWTLMLQGYIAALRTSLSEMESGEPLPEDSSQHSVGQLIRGSCKYCLNIAGTPCSQACRSCFVRLLLTACR